MNILKKIPKPVLVAVILIGASIFFMVSEPPKDACDAQVEVFIGAQSGKLSSLRGSFSSLWARTAKACNESKTMGGCTEFNDVVRDALRDIHTASPECTMRLISNEVVKKFVTESLVLMVRVAWGEAVPELGPTVYGWMTYSEFGLFCNLKFNLQKVMLDEEWEAFVRGVVGKLPGVKQITFREAFERSLFSVRCESVL